MSNTITGVVSNGVIVPSSPCRKERALRSTCNQLDRRCRRICRKSSTAGSAQAPALSKWSKGSRKRWTPMKKGEIWRVLIPAGPGHAQTGERPAIILQELAFNNSLPTTLIAFD
jgi:hypothetical protein